MATGTKWFIFLKQIIQWNTVPVMVILYNYYTMHNSTHSVHKRLLKVWRARLLHPWPSCYVSSPPLSEANCQPFPPPGGPGPPASNMAPFAPGSTHTPSPLSVTIMMRFFYIEKVMFECVSALKKICLWKFAFFALIALAQCALNRLKAQLLFAYCALGFQIAFCLCSATFLKLIAHPCVLVQVYITGKYNTVYNIQMWN